MFTFNGRGVIQVMADKEAKGAEATDKPKRTRAAKTGEKAGERKAKDARPDYEKAHAARTGRDDASPMSTSRGGS